MILINYKDTYTHTHNTSHLLLIIITINAYEKTRAITKMLFHMSLYHYL